MLEKYIYMKNLLFGEWRQSAIHAGQVFNYDGIVNPEIWFSDKHQGKRILFVLKEAYHDEDYAAQHGLTYSLCDALKENSIRSAMWKRVAEWGYGLLNTSGNCIAEYSVLDEAEQKIVLNQIAVMNLKKSNGKPTSNKDNISEYVKADKFRLRTQLDTINPDIIVCGNTFKWFNEIIDNEIETTRDALHTWVYQWNDKIVLDYYHPANQFPLLLNYYGIITSYYLASKKQAINKSTGVNVVGDNKTDAVDQQKLLAQSYIEANDFSNADKCADSILSVDAKNSFGWLIKAKVASNSTNKEKLMSAIKYYQHVLACEKNIDDKIRTEIEMGVKSAMLALVNIFAYEMLGKLPTDFDAYKRKPSFDKNIVEIKKSAELFENDKNGESLNGILSSIPSMLFAASAQMRETLIKRVDASGNIITMNSNYARVKNGIDACIQIAERAVEMETDKKKRAVYLEKLIEWADHRIYLATHNPTNVNGRVQYKLWLFAGNEKANAINKKHSYIAASNAIKHPDSINNKWFCVACGEEMQANENFCIKCGTKRINP